jgi:hypothetical protein
MESNSKTNVISINSQLVKQLEHYQETSRKSWNEISRQIGINSSIISQWRKGKYAGDNAEVDKAVERFLRIENQKHFQIKKDLDFVPILNTKKIQSVLNTAHTDGIIAAITGDTGTGKTMSIKKYMDENDVIYIEANRTYKFPIEYLRRIHTHSKVGKNGIGTMNRLCMDIIEELKGKNILIVVDQADYLNLSAIDIFRTINDASGVGVVFVGLPSFTARLRGNEAEVRQVRDRIKVKLELRSYTASDAEVILEKNWAGLNGLTKTFYKESQGSIRILSGLIYNAKRIIASPKNQGKALDEKVIQKAASMLDIRAQI